MYPSPPCPCPAKLERSGKLDYNIIEENNKDNNKNIENFEPKHIFECGQALDGVWRMMGAIQLSTEAKL